MKNLKAKAVCVMLSASMAAMGLTGCGSDNVDGTKTAITVNDESITLGQANFMLRYQQATMYNYYSKMYSMYGMQMPSEMYDKEGDDGKTTGETFKEQSLDTIEKELLMRQHAEEYGISLTDEEKQQAKEAAQAFADKNGDDVMKKLHATVEDIQDALELYVIQTKIYDPIIADVDTEVSDEEAASSKAGAESRRRIDVAYEILRAETDWEGKPFEIVRMPTAEPIEVVIAPGDEDYELYKGFIDEMGGKFMDGTPWPEGPVHFYAAASYCNFLICNGVVLGQRYYHEGMSEVVKEKDEQAKAVLESCFPDRKVIMIDSLALNLSGGGVHCWTKDVAASC